MRDDGPSNVDMNRQKGFTLIELLVVIAIIGLLAAIVLASLNTARAKGANAAVKANLANARAQAEIYYDTPANYGTVTTNSTSCSLASTVFDPAATNSINPNIVAAGVAGSSTPACAYIGATGGGTAWAATTALKTPEASNTYWCVDSTGTSKGTVGATIGSGDATC